jgi:hypothetical protein
MAFEMSRMETVTSLGPSSGGGAQADRKLDKREEYTLKSDYNEHYDIIAPMNL